MLAAFTVLPSPQVYSRTLQGMRPRLNYADQASTVLTVDADWRDPRKDLPYSQIVEIVNQSTGLAQYVVYDEQWSESGNGNQIGFRTRWSADRVEGQVFFKTGCLFGLIKCKSGIEKGLPFNGAFSSPITIKIGENRATLAGEDGAFRLTPQIVDNLASNTGAIVIVMTNVLDFRAMGQKILLNSATAKSLATLYAKSL